MQDDFREQDSKSDHLDIGDSKSPHGDTRTNQLGKQTCAGVEHHKVEEVGERVHQNQLCRDLVSLDTSGGFTVIARDHLGHIRGGKNGTTRGGSVEEQKAS